MNRPWCAAVVATALTATSTGALAGPADIARDAGCGVCHAAEIRTAGPSWSEISKRYAAEADAAETLFAATREGTAGKWGGAPKLGIGAAVIDDEDLRAVITWILERENGTPPAP